MQRTLKAIADFSGVGLHSGRLVRMRVHPAKANHGIVFRRTDLPGQPLIPARWDLALHSPLCTQLRLESGALISTIEHLMAAFAGLGIQNALVDIDSPEVPILDGSASPFVAGFLRTGLREQAAPLRAIKILREVTVVDGEASATLLPSDGFVIDFSIDFTDAAIGRQSRRLNMANGTFVRELADCRTFCRQSDVDAMHARGLALGGTLENAVVVDGAKVLSPGGLRRKDEPVRHKMLDALGDLALAGAPILGRYRGIRAGHTLTNKLLRALFAQPQAWAMVDVTPEVALSLPGKVLAQQDLAVVA